MSQIGDTSASYPPSVAESRPRVFLVAAVARNGVIGARGKMPWQLPEDLKHFKRLTLGHPVIMGRKTWESLGRPLAGRENIVVSRRPGFAAPGARVVATPEAAIALCDGAGQAFVIGGAEIYAAALPSADALVLTEIDRDYEGDTRFPDWDRKAWRIAEKETHASAQGVRFSYVRYERYEKA